MKKTEKQMDDLGFLSGAERLTLRLRRLYSKAGYEKYSSDRFEPYDTYYGNRSFLKSDGIVTFTDPRGRLMALKPDVTLSIIKNTPPGGGARRLYYCENVFRTEPGSGELREIRQAGLEYIGGEDGAAEAEVLRLALRSLAEMGGDYLLDVGHVGFAAAWMRDVGLDDAAAGAALDALSRKSPSELAEIAGEKADALMELCRLSGPFPETLAAAGRLACTDELRAAVGELEALYAAIGGGEADSHLRLDLSVGGVLDYYNGVIFNGYIDSAPSAVLSGGRYDGLMRRMGRSQPAIGFAVYLSGLTGNEAASGGDDMLTVALPKGRLGSAAYGLFAGLGFECPALTENSRSLVFDCPGKKLRYLLVKPSDVPVYVERGAADIGVAGSDVLREHSPEVYELLDLGIGKCRMVCAGKADLRPDPDAPLRVATKYSNTASRWLESKSRLADIIRLSGSIEIAPVIGLSDVIVDIVETGGTLRENDLCVLEEIAPVSARLIANKASSKFKAARIEDIRARLEAGK